MNALLAEMDGAVSRDGVVVVGACNNASILDPALVRAGRLDRHIPIELPDADGLIEVLRVHLNGELAAKDLTVVGRYCVGGSGAQVEQWVRDARRVARQENRQMTPFDILEAVWDSRNTRLEPATSAIN